MSRHAIDRTVFANAREWRAARARIAANVRHGHARRAEDDRDILPHLRRLGLMRGLTLYAPGAFELGSKHADSFYESVDEWGAILAPGAFRAPS